MKTKNLFLLAALALNLPVAQRAKAASFTPTDALIAACAGHTTTLLPNGKVLATAGKDEIASVWLSSAELYDSVAGQVTLVNLARLSGGAFQFAFAGAPHGTNSVLATTNAASPVANWTVLRQPLEFSPGLYVVSDLGATDSPQRFYRARSP